MAAKTSRGLAYISIALLFEIQQRVNTRATLRRSCQHFWLDEKLRKEAMILSAEVKVLCKTVVCLNFKSIWLSWCKHTYSLIPSFVTACFPPWFAYYFSLLQAELSGLQRHYTFFLQWLAFYSQANAKPNVAQPRPARAKMSRGEVDELICFQRLFSWVQVNLAKPKTCSSLSLFWMAGSKRRSYIDAMWAC